MTRSGTESTERNLQWLLHGIADDIDNIPAIPITGISTDSRTIRKGEVFLACQGAASHGLQFVDQALAAGAAAIAWDSQTVDDITQASHRGDAAAASARHGSAVMIPAAGLTHRLGEIANRWFDAPSERMRISGVTGTNGKTTVAFLIAQCLQMLDKPCAYVGTLGAGIASLDRGPGLTTPGCVDLHRNLADFASVGALNAALEVSSHALHQNRVDGVRFDSVLFTNLSRDHIDYHGDMLSYGETKARFVLSDGVEHRIVLIDSEFGAELANRCKGCRDRLVIVSTKADDDTGSERHVRMTAIDADESGSTVEVESSWGRSRFYLPLAGDFNVANAALVLAQLLTWGIPLANAAGALGKALAPAGRMQKVQPGPGAPLPVVYVDYAHTPAGLQAVLSTLRNHCKGDLWCVFGCGGDRDRGKRGPMGATVARLADRPVVTSDNPRNENPAEIITAVLGAMGEGTVAIEDRAEAIAYAIRNANDDDVILIAGKGHEDYQVTGNVRRPFSDYAVAMTNLDARRSAAGRGQ
ncbi:MAG: UDP-N-acetylmuramoyl-L-alanyl-D-glutamate--2,6-diaminopimelate ligase [Woeseiaceae bacterium]